VLPETADWKTPFLPLEKGAVALVVVIVTVLPVMAAGDVPENILKIPFWLAFGIAALVNVYVPELVVVKTQATLSMPMVASTRIICAVPGPFFV